MAECIEREAAVAGIGVLISRVKRNPYDSKEETYGVLCGLAHAMQRVKEQVPAADVVEVVRCKGCKYYDNDQCYHNRHEHHSQHVYQNDDDFCSYGVRMGGG